MEQKRIYLDNNATTQLAPEAREAMLPFLSEKYGNPNSIHRFGSEARAPLSDAYDKLYDLIEASDQDNVVINSCATEGNNTVLQGVYHTLIRTGQKDHIITSNVEHPSVLNVCQYLETLGVKVTYLPVTHDGFVTPEGVKEALTARTALISLMWANNETGVIFPIDEIACIAREKGVLFHTDATQVIGKIPVSVKEKSIDFLTYSGHKFHAPKGIGALYIRSGVNLPPLLYGGEQMGGLRGGTLNMASIVALGVAARLAKEGLSDELTRVKALRDHFENTLVASLPDTFVNGKRDARTPNTSSLIFKGVEGEAILWDLNENNMAASTGSACATGSEKASYVLTALGIEAALAHSAVRFSLSRYNTAPEIEEAILIVKKTIERLRSISTSYKAG
ncbi:MAG: cysteine desulfurase NifS [Elusimicrobia bacterium RIFOXYB2_FULL_49_7]|nr:MAG: cysteine desulfurase NifS [Elusimicrobia bacterium RIFOXYB2_FULL_49_7]